MQAEESSASHATFVWGLGGQGSSYLARLARLGYVSILP
jgi:hypothetical protein